VSHYYNVINDRHTIELMHTSISFVFFLLFRIVMPQKI